LDGSLAQRLWGILCTMPTTRKSILLGTDGSCALQVDALAESLNRVCKHLRFAGATKPFDLGPLVVSNPATYERLAAVTKPLIKKHASIIVGTDLPYDNNYFMDSDDDSVIIVSFWGWSALTNLPKNNGMVGLLGGMLALHLDSSVRHDENTGCVYDFLGDKSGIDGQLRNGAMCRTCTERLQAEAKRNGPQRISKFDCTFAEGLEDLMIILDEVSMASKRQIDVVDRWKTKAGVEEEFDVFLCHNSEDKPSVRKLYEGLTERGIRPWFDEEHLQPGLPWQEELEKMIPRIRSAAIIVGPNGQGPWQIRELRGFINEFANRGCPVNPVILADAPDVPELPLFLRQFTWVDFRKPKPDLG
jgi:TIR domain